MSNRNKVSNAFLDDGPEPVELTSYNDPRALAARETLSREERDPRARWCEHHATAWLRLGSFAYCPSCLQASYEPPATRVRTEALIAESAGKGAE